MCRESLIDFSKYIINNDGTITSKRFNCILTGAKFNGYLSVKLKKVNGEYGLFRYHRVIWYYFNGEIPNGMEIDHINGIRDDNRLENLRVLTHLENMRNPLTRERLKKFGENNPFFGKCHSENTKRKLSELHKSIKRERNSLGQYI